MIKVYVLVSFYDDTGLHKAGTITQVPEDEFNPLYMKKLPDIPTGASDLADLDDVNLTNLGDGEILIYQSSTGKWINGAVPAGVESLSELDDVDVASAANGNVLTYDSTDEEWKAAAPAAPSNVVVSLTITTPFSQFSNGSPFSLGTVEYTFNQLNAILIGGDNVYFKDTNSCVVAVTSSIVADSVLCGTFIQNDGTVNRLVFECTDSTNWTVTRYV